jgi:hypothetical protein
MRCGKRLVVFSARWIDRLAIEVPALDWNGSVVCRFSNVAIAGTSDAAVDQSVGRQTVGRCPPGLCRSRSHGYFWTVGSIVRNSSLCRVDYHFPGSPGTSREFGGQRLHPTHAEGCHFLAPRATDRRVSRPLRRVPDWLVALSATFVRETFHEFAGRPFWGDRSGRRDLSPRARVAASGQVLLGAHLG